MMGGDRTKMDRKCVPDRRAATYKLRRPRCVLVRGTIMSWRSAERTFVQPEMPATAGGHGVPHSDRTSPTVMSEG